MAANSRGLGALGRGIAMVACLAALAILGLHLVRYAGFAAAAVAHPYALDFGEGIVWQQMALIPGPRMYGDITAYPYIVFHYPPLFHLAARAVAGLGVDALAAGRGVSVAATMVLCLGIFLAARRFAADRGLHGKAALLGCALGALFPLTMTSFWFWSALFRSDALALALVGIGFALSVNARGPDRLSYAGMLCFVLAVYAKQTAIVAPAAVLAAWLVRDPRHAIRLGLFGLAVGLVPLAALTLATGGGFLRHILFYNINPFDLRYAYWAVWRLRHQAFGVLLVLLALGWLLWLAVGLLRRSGLAGMLRGDIATFRLAMLGLYALGATAMLVALGKEGASSNYFNEWYCVAAVAMGVLLATALAGAPPAQAGRRFAWLGLAVPAAPLLLLAHLATMPAPALPRDVTDPAVVRSLDALGQRLRTTEAPVLSDEMVLLMRAGKPVPLESAIFGALARVGAWDERPFVAMLAQARFAFILTEGSEAGGPYVGRFTPAMRQAIAQAYPRKTVFGPYTLHERE